MAPSDNDYMVWNAKGNEATCNAQGVMRMAGACATLLYSCLLNLFHLAMVKYEKSDKYIRTRIEPFLHAIPIICGLVSSITMLVNETINDSGGGSCWLPVFDPPHCIGYEDGTIRDGFEIPCGRGRDGAVLFSYLFFFVITFLPPIFISVSLGMIYKSVIQQEMKISKYGASAIRRNIANRRSSMIIPVTETSASWMDRIKRCFKRSERTSNTRSNQASSQRRAVLHKAVAYSTSYFLAWSFGVIGVSFSIANVEWPHFVWYMSVILNPLQGLFTLLIFIHPRVMSARTTKQLSWCQAFAEAFWFKGTTRRGRGSQAIRHNVTISNHRRQHNVISRLRSSCPTKEKVNVTADVITKKRRGEKQPSIAEEEKSEIPAPENRPYSYSHASTMSIEYSSMTSNHDRIIADTTSTSENVKHVHDNHSKSSEDTDMPSNKNLHRAHGPKGYTTHEATTEPMLVVSDPPLEDPNASV